MVRPTRHVTEIGEQRIAWLEAGPASSGPASARNGELPLPTVVLVHGLGTSEAWWTRTIPRLAARYRVLAVDLVGFGRSAGQPVRLDAAADQLAAWADAVGLARAIWVGHSMGGLVVGDLAARHPNLVERLVLVDAAGMALPQRVTAHLLNVLRGSPYLPARAYPIAVACVLRCGPLAIVRAAHQILATDLEARLRRIVAPALVVWGDRDRLLPPAFGRRLAATIPGARFVVIERAGHSPMWERPEAFEAVLEAFIDEPGDAPGERRRPTARPRDEVTVAPDVLAATGGRVASRYLPVGDWAIHVRVGRPETDPASPPIVFLHGYGLASRAYLPTLRLLARRHLVVAPDLPGFGWSSEPSSRPDVPGLAAALGAILDAAGIGRAVLVGTTLGSQVAVQLAADHPDRVLGLVLVGPTFAPAADADPSIAAHVRRLGGDLVREWPSIWFERLRDLVLAGPLRVLATIRDGLAHDVEPLLADIRVPVVIVRGEHDGVASRGWVRRLAGRLPNGRALEIRGAARALGYGSPRSLARIVDEHVTALAAAARPHADGTLPIHLVTAVHRRRPTARPRRARAGPPRA